MRRELVDESWETEYGPIGFLASTSGLLHTLLRREASTDQTTTAPESGASGESVIFDREMPKLEALLKRQKIAFAVLERDRVRPMRNVERVVWVILVSLSLAWGVLTGIAIAANDFWLAPAAAILGCLSLVVCLFVVLKHVTTSSESLHHG